VSLPVDFGARLAATAGDPSAFSELVFGAGLHAGQRRYATNATSQVNFLLPGNSWGKTAFIERFAVYLAWFKLSDRPPSSMKEWLEQSWKGLIASYNYPIARESFDRLLTIRKNREELRALIPNVTLADPARMTFANGSVLDWGSLDGQGKLVEAARRQVILVDEAGHIPDLSYTFDNILYPRTMGVGGRIHLLGTPKAHSDPYLLEIYERGKGGTDPFYYSQSGSVLENKFWPEEEKQRVLDNPRYVTGWQPCGDESACDEPIHWHGQHPILTTIGKQVILGHFVLAGGYFFNRMHVARMFTGDYEVTWEGENHFHVAPQPGRLYMGAFDLGGNKLKGRKKGKGSDPTVGFVIDFTERPWRVVCFDFIEGGSLDWQGKYELMAQRFHDYPMPYLLIDSTGQIDSVSEALQDRGVEVEGIHFGGNSNKKLDMLRNLQLCMEMEWGDTVGVIRSPLIKQLKHELDHYVIPDNDIAQDCVMALCMAAHHIAQNELPASVAGEVY